MKNKKFLFTILVLIVAIVAMAIYAVVSNIALRPTITEHEFPFSVTYELNGVTETVEGVCAVSYTGNDGYVKATTRQYEGVYIGQREDLGSAFEICIGEDWNITLFTHIYPDYLMGDPMYEYFEDGEVYEPLLSYSNWTTGDSAEGLELPEYGAKIISWELPQPIENSFEFSHIAHMSSNEVFPFMLMAVAVLLLILIFVRRDKTMALKPIDKAGVVFNILIAVILLPVITVYGFLIDINGSSPALSHQMGYLVPAFMILGLAVSISLRRNGCSKGSFIVQFAGPVYLVLHLLLAAIGC